ncbi:hypothetical protein BKA69DRAFT_119127 [Paraphysoderma sedebokerense]|nr:hypothetical protein BKA69DRAFT_119127 [Paraphysoderma sedebokerense]
MHKPIKLDVYPDSIDGRRVLKYFGMVFQPNEQVNVTDNSSQAVFQIRISIASLRDNRHTLRSILSSNSNSMHSSHPVSQHHIPPSSIPPEHQRNLSSFEKSKSYPSPSNDGSNHSLLNSSSGLDSNNTSGTVTAASSPVFSKPSLPESVGSAQGSKSIQLSQPLKSQAQVPPIPNTTPTSAQSDGDVPSSNSTSTQVSQSATASTTVLPSASSQGPRLTTYVSGTKATSSSPKIQPSNISNQSTAIDQTKSKESAPATSSSSSSHSVSNSTASTTTALNPGTTSVPPTKPVSPKPSNVSGSSNVNGSGGSSGTGGSGIQNKSVSVSSTA